MNQSQRAAAERLAEFERLPRKLLDIACRVRANECLFHDDEFIDDASHALKEALDLLRELAAEPVVNQQMTTEPVQAPSPLAGTMAEQFLQVVAGIWHDHPDYSIRQTLDALNAKFPAEPAQEPIARLHDDGHFSWKSDEARRQFDSKHEYMGWSMDVYAASPQQRKPLTFGEIEGKCRNAFLLEDGYGLPSEHPERYRVFRDGFYAAWNRAHGITGEPT